MGGAEAVLSGLVVPSGEAGSSAGGGAVTRRGEAGVTERVGLTAEGAGLKAEGAGLVGEVGMVRRCDEEEDEEDRGMEDRDDEGVPGGGRAPGDTEKVVGVRRPNRASSSLHTARLRLPPSSPTSEPLASSWQRSTKLPRRTASRSWCRRGRGLWGWAGPCMGWAGPCMASLLGFAKGSGGGACRGRLPHSEADEPEAPAAPRPPAE